MFNQIYNKTRENNAYLIEIDEELKFFMTRKRLDDVKKLHDIIYKDYNVIWSVNYLSEYTKQYIEKNLQNPDNDGFYSDLEGLDLDRLKHILNSLNSSLSSFQELFKINVPTKEKLVESFTDVRSQTNISTRMGDPLSKNMGLRKLPSIWNTNSFLENNLKEDKKNLLCSNINDIGSLLPYNDLSLGNLCSIAEEKHSCFIYYNKHYSKVVVLDKTIEIDIFPELKYINTIDGTEDDIINLKDALQHNLFFNVEQLEVFVKYYNVKDKVMSVQRLKKFIKKHFNLNNKIEHKIKFTTLFNKITELMLLKNNIQEKKKLKQLLPKVLKSLKLNKKRYKDGNYWYGIELKEVKELDVAKLFKNMMKERNHEAESKIGEGKTKWIGDKNNDEENNDEENNDEENDEENDEKESKIDPTLMEDISSKVNQLVSLFISNNNSDIVNTIINNLDLDSNLPRTSTSSFEVVDI
jgi:hypothetical protein